MRFVGISMLAAAACALAVTSTTKGTAEIGGVQYNAAQGEETGSLDGVWRSRGYGWLMEIRDDRARFYDESVNLCMRSDESDRGVNDLTESMGISADGRTLRMPIDDPSYLFTFDKIEALPAACRKTPDSAPDAVLNAVIEIFSTHYAFFDDRKVDWRSLAGTARHQLGVHASEDRLLDVVGTLVSSVGDAHVSLEAERNGRWEVREASDGPTLTRLAAQAARENISAEDMQARWQWRYWNEDIARVLLDGQGTTVANDNIAYAMIGGDIGYLAVRSMEGFAKGSNGPDEDAAALHRVMDEVMALFRDARAVIVDISINDGGYDTVARALAGRFAAERTLGYYKYAGDAGAREPQAIHVDPSEGLRFTGPVYLLTSGASLSAAEIFTMSMRALPNVTHLGEPTNGALSDILSKQLPNGWWVNLSNEVYLDAEGKRWEGAGIPPDIAIDVFLGHDVTNGHVEAVRTIVDAITRGVSVDPSRS